MKHLLIALLVLAFGTVAAVATNVLRAEPLPWIYVVEGTLDDEKVLEEHSADLEAMRVLQEQGIPYLIDARKTVAYEKEHILGALSIPFDEPEEHLEKVFMNCLPDQPVVVYCEGASCESSKVVCQFLKDSGYEDVQIFLPGFDTLVEAGFEVISGPGPYGEDDGMGYDPAAFDPNDPNQTDPGMETGGGQ